LDKLTLLPEIRELFEDISEEVVREIEKAQIFLKIATEEG